MFQVKKDIPIHPDYYKYPYSDGELMAESTLHLEYIKDAKENLEVLTQGKDIFVAADLLWYPEEGKVNICKAPDVMVVIGRPKGHRYSYLQWHEENMPPQIVFEIFSKSNRRRRNKENLLEFYEKYGVEEYYSYDPETNIFVVHLRQGEKFIRLEGLQKWVSPLLQIRFEVTETRLEMFYPNGLPFVNLKEMDYKYQYQKREADEAKKWANLTEKRLLAAKQEADVAKQEADVAKQKAEEAEKQKKQLEEKLRQLGIDPSAI